MFMYRDFHIHIVFAKNTFVKTYVVYWIWFSVGYQCSHIDWSLISKIYLINLDFQVVI